MANTPANEAARIWIEHLGLEAHPEGGWFRESHRCDESIPASALPDRYGAARSFGTAIYFLITHDVASRMHRLKSDETWHFHCGSPLTLHLFDPATHTYETRTLDATQPSPGAAPQCTIRRGLWFGATVEGPFTLIGATVYPGFDFADFELATAGEWVESMRRQGVDSRVLP